MFTDAATGARVQIADEDTDVEFFGIHIRVRDPKLAALLNSDVTDDVVVVARRTAGLLSDDDR